MLYNMYFYFYYLLIKCILYKILFIIKFRFIKKFYFGYKDNEVIIGVIYIMFGKLLEERIFLLKRL